MKIFLIGIAVLIASVECSAGMSGKAGAFSRMGFGSRGMGMGNAMTAVTEGEVFGYYNPATIPLSNLKTISAAFGILALDRKMNFLGYSQPLAPSAGLSVGLINSGVSDIDGRDADGEQTGALRTSENQLYLSFANKFKGGFSLGLSFKLYYHHLYTDVSSTTIGIDVGLLIPVAENFTLGATVRDINSEYKWDTSELYGQSGNTTTDKVPVLYTFGGAYVLPDSFGLVSLDLQASDQSTVIGRIGVEAPIVPELTLRAGLDRVDFREEGNGVRPSFGFTLARAFSESWTPALTYAYVIEPFATSGLHMISLSVRL